MSLAEVWKKWDKDEAPETAESSEAQESLDHQLWRLKRKVRLLERKLSRLGRFIDGNSLRASGFVVSQGGRDTAWLGHSADGATELRFMQRNGTTRLTVSADARGLPAIVLYDSNGRKRSGIWLDGATQQTSGLAPDEARIAAPSPSGLEFFVGSSALELWAEAMDWDHEQTHVSLGAAVDGPVAVCVHGWATQFQWAAGTNERTGTALIVSLANKSTADIRNLAIGRAVLVDDRGYQYSPASSTFYWAEGSSDFNVHSQSLVGEGRQEGFLLFPPLKGGSSRFVRFQLRDNFMLGEEAKTCTIDIRLP